VLLLYTAACPQLRSTEDFQLLTNVQTLWSRSRSFCSHGPAAWNVFADDYPSTDCDREVEMI